jgi:hypothetical protein
VVKNTAIYEDLDHILQRIQGKKAKGRKYQKIFSTTTDPCKDYPWIPKPLDKREIRTGCSQRTHRPAHRQLT